MKTLKSIIDWLLTASRWVAYWNGSEVETETTKAPKKSLDDLRKEKIESMGTNWVCHPAYDAARNSHHAIQAAPKVLASVKAAAVAAGRL